VSASDAGPFVHRAPSDRDGGEAAPAESAKAGQGAAPPGAPAPDIDQLARRVYDVLKRRLAAERRRGG
jgi:hypothetical protein